MTATKLHTIPLKVANCYLLQGESTVLVDAGPPGREAKIAEAFARHGVPLESLALIVLTHGHFDHTGSAAGLQARTGAKLAMHPREAAWLERGERHVSPGVTRWGRAFARVARLLLPLVPVPPARVDVPIEAETSLAPFGVAGRIVPTPGHTLGSVSVLLDGGEAIVGDLAMNGLPARLGAGLPSMAEDLAQVRASWEHLLALGVHTVYPGHGGAFPAQVVRRALEDR